MSAAFLVVPAAIALTAGILSLLWRKRRRERRVQAVQADRRRRIDALSELVAAGERGARFDPAVVTRLRRFVDALREESRR